MSASNRSFSSNRTSFSTPAFLAFCLASQMLTGLMSIPTPRAPRFLAAAITMLPSPQPRSYTTSAFFTPANFSIASTAGSVVGTYGTSGSRRGAVDWAASVVTESTATTAQELRSDLRSSIESPPVSERTAPRDGMHPVVGDRLWRRLWGERRRHFCRPLPPEAQKRRVETLRCPQECVRGSACAPRGG